MDTVEQIVSDEILDKVWGSANFGNASRRDVIKDALLKCLGEYRTGHTAETIVRELGLVYHNKWELTKLGKKYLFTAFYHT